MTGVDVDDVHRCPLGPACEGCASGEDLAVVTFGTPVGVLCRTICGTCIGNATFPPLGWPQTADLVCAHCGHSGIDLDQMAAALAAEHG